MRENGEASEHTRVPGPHAASGHDLAFARLVRAARALFFAHGFDAVSTDMLAREAKMSKSTMYRLAPNKDAIFEAVIDRESERFNGKNEPIPDDYDEFMEKLHTFGTKFLELIADPEVAQFERLMLSRASSSDGCAQLFFERAHQQVGVRLREFIEKGQKLGFLGAAQDPSVLAPIIAYSWLGQDHAQLQLDICKGPYENLDQHVSDVIEIVLSPLRPKQEGLEQKN